MRQLGQLEASVMHRLWEWQRPVAVREVVEHLQQDRTIAYTTVMTVLDNLHSKGLVSRHKEGRAYVYSATVTREAYTTGLLDQVLAQSVDRSAALLHFVGHLPEQELSELRSALAHVDDSHAGGNP